MPQITPQLLLVEDDGHFAAWVSAVLTSHFPAPQLTHAPTLALALQALRDGMANGADWALAIVDLNLPDGSGVDVIRASGYIVKATMDADLVRTVDQVLAGGSPITPAIARLLLLEFHHKPQAEAPEHGDGGLGLSDLILEKITERETEVLRLLARGYGNKEIASRLGFSASTADTHVRSIYRKLSVNSRAQLRSILTE
jgi:DNA-binding NarL/FixJ family response regulator